VELYLFYLKSGKDQYGEGWQSARGRRFTHPHGTVRSASK
jgi:hypothetical protein